VRINYFQTEGFRLSAIYALVFALSTLILGVSVILINGHALRDQVLEAARTDLVALQLAYDEEGMEEVHEVIGRLKGVPSASELFLLQRDGERIDGNLPQMPPQLGIVELGPTPQHPAILGIGAQLAPDLYVFSGGEVTHIRQVQTQIQQALLWVFLGALLLAVIGGVLVSRSFLGRTDAMARACRAIMDGDLKARLPLRGTHDGLDRLAATVNEMLDRIAVLMENLGQVTNDIAHDLRTPVAHLRQRLESGRLDCANPLRSEATFDAAIEKTDEILGIFAALLRIVQIEDGSRRATFSVLPLGALLEQLRDMFAPVAEAANHTLTLEADSTAEINGDRMLLLQLFSNLIENAILHTPGGTHIRIGLLDAGPGKVTAVVADDGPGVPSEEHAKLFRRLYRREASRTTPGYGLGLSVVAAIAELHKATVVTQSLAPGLAVCISFETVFHAHDTLRDAANDLTETV
jgi:signal transduction histidine kinase